ncbi:IclR family transcriptional regulator [Mesorhizobium sp. KR2-14]|uniref:IclR family transcriptional regulator n=1 Tax=Mesorhizobium sp. KR2-14 TaxID=3156610 RepID=UPI0032B46DB0
MPKRPAKTSDETAKDERYRAPALDKGLDILELLSEQPSGLTRAEIVKAMGRGPSEVYRMLERLVARDYVSRSPEGDRYALTMKLFVLAHRHPPVRRLVARALPLMDGFARDAGQSCHLVVADRDAAIVVAHASCPGNWEFGIRIGAHIDLLTTGSGQTLLAFQDEHSEAEIVARWQGTRMAEAFAGLVPALVGYRSAGHRIGESQQIRGVDDISVPILSPEGYAIAVLTCPYIQRLDNAQADITQTLALLKDVATKLSLS